MYVTLDETDVRITERKKKIGTKNLHLIQQPKQQQQ